MKISILAFLLLQAFVACQQHPEETLSLTAGIGFPTDADPAPASKTASPFASNLILQSLDGGQTWQAADAGLPANIIVRNLVVNGDEVFLNAENKPQPDAAPEAFPKALLFRGPAAASPLVWEYENGSFQPEHVLHLFPSKNGLCAFNSQDGFFQKIEGLNSWMPVYPAQKGEWVHDLFEAADGALFVGSVNGIFKSTDDGTTWKNVHSKSQATHFSAANDVLFADAYNGIQRSTDGGEHWDWALQKPGMSGRTRQIEGGVLAILNNTKPVPNQDRLLASTDGGKTWQDLDKNLPPSRLIFDARQAGKYLFCSIDSGVYCSNDQGKTWELVLKAHENRAFRLAVSGETVYAVFMDVGC